MKKSELKKIIREEIGKVLNEESNLPNASTNIKINLKKDGIYVLDGGLNKNGDWDEKSLKKANVLYYTTNSFDKKLEKYERDGMVFVDINNGNIDVREY